MTEPVKKVKFLTNKDLLEEIHKSKTSYCEFVDKKYSKYDFIVNDLNKATEERIEQARQKKVTDTISQIRKEHSARGIKNFKPEVSIDEFPVDTIVIRLMTFDHIPINEEKVHKAKTEGERHIRCNFPPFQHYIYKDGEFVLVGKSHYKEGEFSLTHGKMTNKLALMFMMMVERYGHRGNWRGYCVDEETQALTKRGWLNIDEINEEDKVLSYQEGHMKWSDVLSIYRDEKYNGSMHQLVGDGIDALITPGHKLITTSGIKKIEDIDSSDVIILLGTSFHIEQIGNKSYTTISYNDIKKEIVNYKGRVWCPETEYGSFLVRRNGTIYLTGNSYLDEMKCQALLQLSQVGLQFDESRSDIPNPFAYLTQVTKASFIRALNLEKRNQDIRDDLLIMAGAMPSYTKQTEHEIEQQKINAEINAAKKDASAE